MNHNRSHPGQFDGWLIQRQQNLLATAYEGAKEIQSLEEKYFDGSKIAYRPEIGKTVFDYVKGLRNRQLLQVRISLAQFHTVSFLLGQKAVIQGTDSVATERSSHEQEVLNQLGFIDTVVSKYRDQEEDWEWMAIAQTNGAAPETESAVDQTTDQATDKQTKKPRSGESPDGSGLAMPQPRPGWSLFRNLNSSLGREMDADEQQLLQEIRLRRLQRRQAVRWILILLVVPLMIHVFTKVAILNPVFGNYSNQHPTQIELNKDIRRHFLAELTEAKGVLEVRQLLGDKITEQEKQESLYETAVELWQESRNEALNGLKNVIADGAGLLAFILIVFLNRGKLTVVRSATHRAFLGLGDPLKVFLFILVTDMFVGFHSAEGWEVILSGLAEHLGVPENKTAIYGFIATVPVILDSCIKFWIFTYLTRHSPSASAIFERMNS